MINNTQRLIGLNSRAAQVFFFFSAGKNHIKNNEVRDQKADGLKGFLIETFDETKSCHSLLPDHYTLPPAFLSLFAKAFSCLRAVW